MELIESPKSAYLLDASLEILHFESSEWLSEIAFWKDEIAFFQKLLEKIAPKAISADNKLEMEHLQNEITLFRYEILDELKGSVLVHEKYLASLLDDSQKDSEQFYREKHKTIADQISGFAKEFKDLKSDIFSFAEKLL